MTESPQVPFKVLYIEDNASNLLLVKRLFRDREDLVLRTATRAQEGLMMARVELPGLILLDLHLPDMSGVDLLTALRDEPSTSEIPVVVVSADATRDQMENLRARGVVDYVTKPFEVRELMALIDGYAAGNPAGDPVLDSRRVAELLDLDIDSSTFRALASTAMSEAAEQIGRIAAAASADEGAAVVGDAAHGLKSSAAIIGAYRLGALAETVEEAARSGQLPDPSVVSELRTTLGATQRALELTNGGE